MSENELIAKAAKGDISAFEQLVADYQSMVYNIALKLLCNTEDAADAAQDALIKVYRNIGSFNGKSKFSTWIYRITYNTCLDKMRKSKNQEYELLDDTAVDTASTPQSALMDKERAQIIQKAIYSLPHDQKTVIVMRDIHGLSYDEIADVLNCSLGTVKSRINRARIKLREMLSDYLEQKAHAKRHNN
ncbi:MAG: sigma-70 family RNA polymerase sigma factor [Eubacteriales bacterium]|nr:sigma-70 family RNA polymerase sigma factor [Eubacteriales bacterium]